MERCQPLVVFGVDPGSLGGRGEEKHPISGKISHSVFRKRQENDTGKAVWGPGVASPVAGKYPTPTTLFQAPRRG